MGGASKDMYQEHMDKAKGVGSGWEVGMGSGGQAWWGENGDNCTWTTIKNKK